MLLDIFISDLPDEERSQLGPRFERVSAAYNRPNFEELFLTPSTDAELPAEVLEKYAILARLYLAGNVDEDAPSAQDISDLHNDLCALVDGIELSQGSRHHLLAEIHYRTMKAGINYGQPDAIRTGSGALFEQPRNSQAQDDQTEAARIILLTLQNSQQMPANSHSEILAKIKEFIWHSLRMIFRNNVIRFVAVGVNRIFPLLATYVDYLLAAPGSEAEALELIFTYQGALTRVALNFSRRIHPQDQDWPELIIDELDSLLRAQAVATEEKELDPALTAVRGQHPGQLLWPPCFPHPAAMRSGTLS